MFEALVPEYTAWGVNPQLSLGHTMSIKHLIYTLSIQYHTGGNKSGVTSIHYGAGGSSVMLPMVSMRKARGAAQYLTASRPLTPVTMS